MNNTEVTFSGKKLKDGLSLDSYIATYGFGIGETFYTISDSIGEVFSTIFVDKIEQFFTSV